MSGLSVIPPGVSASMFRPAPLWVRWRLRSSYTSGSPALPGDFLSTPLGIAVSSAYVNLANITWGTNATAPLRYGTNALVWTYQGISAKRLAFILPPLSGAPPLQVPPYPLALDSSRSEVRLVATMAWAGSSGLGSDWLLNGFMVNDWNLFGGGSAVDPWPDRAVNAYIGILTNRFDGTSVVAVKAAGAAKVVLANLPQVVSGVPFVADHRFYAATMANAARYVLRVNGIVVYEYSFGSAGAPSYTALYGGLTPAIYGSYYDASGSARSETIVRLDCLAGVGANTYVVD